MTSKDQESANWLIDQLVFFLTMDGMLGSMTRGESYQLKMMEYVKCLFVLKGFVNGNPVDPQFRKVVPLLGGKVIETNI